MSERDDENPSGLPSPTGASAGSSSPNMSEPRGSSSPDMSRPERPSRVDKETQTDRLDSNGNVVSPQDQPPQDQPPLSSGPGR
jgi:hypothetical protein